jgi:hypothetical protein
MERSGSRGSAAGFIPASASLMPGYVLASRLA